LTGLDYLSVRGVLLSPIEEKNSSASIEPEKRGGKEGGRKGRESRGRGKIRRGKKGNLKEKKREINHRLDKNETSKNREHQIDPHRFGRISV
jgi:hypothetical protein